MLPSAIAIRRGSIPIFAISVMFGLAVAENRERRLECRRPRSCHGGHRAARSRRPGALAGGFRAPIAFGARLSSCLEAGAHDRRSRRRPYGQPPAPRRGPLLPNRRDAAVARSLAPSAKVLCRGKRITPHTEAVASRPAYAATKSISCAAICRIRLVRFLLYSVRQFVFVPRNFSGQCYKFRTRATFMH